MLASFIGIKFEETEEDLNKLDLEDVIKKMIDLIKTGPKNEMETYRTLKRKLHMASSQVSNLHQPELVAKKPGHRYHSNHEINSRVHSMSTSLERDGKRPGDSPVYRNQTHRDKYQGDAIDG